MKLRFQVPILGRRHAVSTGLTATETHRIINEQAASMDAAIDGMAIHDVGGCFVYMNTAHARIYGYDSPSELMGQSWHVLYSDDELQRFESEIMPEFWRIGRWRGEAIGRKKDGSTFPQEISISRIVSGGLVCVVRDITEQKKREEAHRRLAEIVEWSEDSIVSVDCAGIIQTWNKAAEKLHGYTAAEAIGRPITFLTAPEYLEKVNNRLSLLRAGNSVTFESRRIRKDGRRIEVSVRFSPIRDERGKIIGGSTIARDITAQKRQEEAHARLAAIVESSQDAIYSTGLNEIINSWNHGAEMLFGFIAAEAIGKPVSIIGTPESAEADKEMKQRVLQGERVYIDTERRCKSGSLQQVSLTFSPIFNAEGAVVGISRIARDISERKRIEAEREQETRRMKLLTDVAHQLLSTASPESIVREIFSRFAPELGLDIYLNYLLKPGTNELVLDSYSGIRDEDTALFSRLVFGQPVCGVVAQERRPWTLMQIQQNDDPKLAVLRVCGLQSYTCHPLEAGGKLIGTLSFGSHTNPEFTDQDLDYINTICDFVALAEERSLYQRGLEGRVQERTVQLRETIGELEAFSYSVSHDMRAPLRAMRSFAHILMEDYGAKLGTEGTEYLQKISAAASNMDNLIQDVLTYARVVRGQFKMAPVDLDQLLREVIENYPQLHIRNAEITIISPLPKVLGNAGSLTQCISNLLGNAVKFVAPGVQPRVKVHAETRDSKVRLFVQDNGIGINPKFMERIFGIFERGVESAEYEGTGIGLAIVKKSIERMGGQVGVESKPGQGSCFWIELDKA